MPESSPEWAGSATVLIEPFDKAESVAADNFTRWKHPVPRERAAEGPD